MPRNHRPRRNFSAIARCALAAGAWLSARPVARATDADTLFREGVAAESRLDSRGALALFLQADRARPDDPATLQKIARQYSDLVVDLPTVEEKKRSAQSALAYAERAAALAPRDPVNLLSLAICHGTLAVYSDVGTKVKYSRLVKDEAERALALDPGYAWAHHVLGRWNCEVASLGAPSRLFVSLFQGGLPDASVAVGVAHLERAVALEPGELEHVLELGFAYLAAGRKADARAQFEKGLAMPSREKHDEPAKERAREALARLGR